MIQVNILMMWDISQLQNFQNNEKFFLKGFDKLAGHCKNNQEKYDFLRGDQLLRFTYVPRSYQHPTIYQAGISPSVTASRTIHYDFDMN